MPNKALIAALLFSLFAGLARAEGNYNGMNFGFLLYALIAVCVLGFQALYVLCIGAIGFGARVMWALALLLLDAAVGGMLVSASSPALETPFPYIFWVIPGFVAIFCIKNYAADRPGGEAEQ